MKKLTNEKIKKNQVETINKYSIRLSKKKSKLYMLLKYFYIIYFHFFILPVLKIFKK